MPDEFEQAALDFARYCLKQPDASIHDWSLRLTRSISLPEFTPPGMEDIGCRDIGDVLPVVTCWCRANNVRFFIKYETNDGGFSCRFELEYRPNLTIDPIEMGWGEGDKLCGYLLAGCVAVAKTLDDVRGL